MGHLRVGVSGHRLLADPEAVARAVDAALDRVAGADTGPLVAVSSLAEGADRIVAERVLARPGGSLCAVLPLDPDDYAADFRGDASRRQFEALLAVASSVTVVPADPADPAREAAYARAGTAVLAACDVVLALWDGGPARGRGGTAELVDEARVLGRPVVVVDVERGEA